MNMKNMLLTPIQLIYKVKDRNTWYGSKLSVSDTLRKVARHTSCSHNSEKNRKPLDIVQSIDKRLSSKRRKSNRSVDASLKVRV